MITKSDTVHSLTTGGFTSATFEAFLRSRDDPAWLIERRRQAFAHFQGFPLPSSRDEEWRRSDIRGLRLDAFSPLSAQTADDAHGGAFDAIWKSLKDRYATGIAHTNGTLVHHPDAARQGGAILIDLDRAVKEYPEILERFLLTEAVTPTDDFFAAPARSILDGRGFALCSQGREG